jgi:hypothetical protein
VGEDCRAAVRTELDSWNEADPCAVRFLRSPDRAIAVARPDITVVLTVTDWRLAGGLADHAGHGASESAAEAAVNGGIAAGEFVVSGTAEGVHQAAGQLFRRLQARYAKRRAQWLAGWLDEELPGEMLADLRRQAEAPRSVEFAAVEQLLKGLRATLP